MASTLPAKQQRFVEEYLKDLHATKAAVRAGYSKKTAHVQGSRLLRKADIFAAIEAAKEKRALRTGITQDRVLLELEELAFSDIKNYEVDAAGNVTLAAGAPPKAMKAVASIKRKVSHKAFGANEVNEVEVEIKLWDKPGTLKLAGRHVGLFADRVELTGKNGSPLLTPQTIKALTDDELKAKLLEMAASL